MKTIASFAALALTALLASCAPSGSGGAGGGAGCPTYRYGLCGAGGGGAGGGGPCTSTAVIGSPEDWEALVQAGCAHLPRLAILPGIIELEPPASALVSLGILSADNTTLTSLSLPALTTVEADMEITNNTQLTVVSLPALRAPPAGKGGPFIWIGRNPRLPQCYVDVVKRQIAPAYVDDEGGNSGMPNLCGLTITSPTLPAVGFGGLVGTTSPETLLTIQNYGVLKSGSIGVAITGTNPDEVNANEFVIGTNTCTTLAPSATCTIGVLFRPTVAGLAAATFGVSANPGGIAYAALRGDVPLPPTITATPSSFDFGQVGIGSSSAETLFFLKNIGDSGADTLESMSFVGPGAADFEIGPSGNGCGVAGLQGGATCAVSVRFTPTATGARTATLTGSSGSGVVLVTAALSGTGL